MLYYIIILWYNLFYCIYIILCFIILYDVILYVVVLYFIVLYDILILLYSIILHYIILYYIILYYIFCIVLYWIILYFNIYIYIHTYELQEQCFRLHQRQCVRRFCATDTYFWDGSAAATSNQVAPWSVGYLQRTHYKHRQSHVCA